METLILSTQPRNEAPSGPTKTGIAIIAVGGLVGLGLLGLLIWGAINQKYLLVGVVLFLMLIGGFTANKIS